MTQTATPSDLHVRIERELHIAAPIDIVFETVLEQMGPGMMGEDGKTTMNMKIEPFPGGRWYRDLGEGRGHLWGHVQSIKAPELLEFTGPFFMSLPVSNNLIYRFAEEGGKTKLTFVHTAFGPVPEELSTGMDEGWGEMLENVKKTAESRA